jgi:sec-independent protein translocase protein TatC
MAVAAGHIGHEDRLSTVEHLHELRMRLFVSLAAVAVAFALCMWQNHALLRIVNRPLAAQTQRQAHRGEGPLAATYALQQGTRGAAGELQRVVAALQLPGSGLSAAARARLAGLAPELRGLVGRLSAPPGGERPVTLGIGEPFTTTIGVALLFALVFALPVILYELYGFVLPAFSPDQRLVSLRLVLATPLLFVTGVAFGYFVVLPAAIRFLLNFNSGEFNVLVQAGQYYHFAAVTLLAMGLVFQVPVAILAVTRAGIVSARTLRAQRRYAVLACAAVAALLPGDVVTMLLETIPLYVLFELGVLLASIGERRARRRELAATGELDEGAGTA